MLHRKAICLLVVVLLFPIVSCTRLKDESPPKGMVLLGREKLPALDSVPLEWGKLVSVSATPIYPEYFQLWFQDENGKVRMVPFDMRNARLADQAVIVPRK